MRPFTFVLSGPITSRFYKGINTNSLVEMFKIIKLIDDSNEIIISTYANELPRELEKYIDTVVYVKDPGPDNFRTTSFPIGTKSSRSMSNITRMCMTSIIGIQKAKHDIVIKSRVELIPEDHYKFKAWYESIEAKIEESKIGFFTEAYSGINFSIDGILLSVPDILQIGNKKTILNVWEDSFSFWDTNKKILTRRAIRYPLGFEQILGLCYLARYHHFDLNKRIRQLRKYYFSIELIRKIIAAEKSNFIFTSYKNSGFSVNYFKGLIGIRLPTDVLALSMRDLGLRVMIVFAKRVKHYYRRLFREISHKILNFSKSYLLF